MLKPQIHHPSSLFPKVPFIHGNFGIINASIFPNHIPRSSSSLLPNKRTQRKIIGVGSVNNNNNYYNYNYKAGGKIIKAITAAEATTEESLKVKAVLTVKLPVGNANEERSENTPLYLQDESILLELVSAELDPNTGLEKPRIKGYAHGSGQDYLEFKKFKVEFEVPSDFGEVGAIFVENEHQIEMHLKNITLDGFPNGPLHFTCNSWIESNKLLDTRHKKRIFFSNKSYLPSQTPNGLRRLRDEELELLRGDGQGERKKGERIYDYDVYNDLGEPDKSDDSARPVLGGQEHPYPRRCRTGRPRCKKDPDSETRSDDLFYVPRDEEFSEVKEATFSVKTVYSVLHALVPSLETYFKNQDHFPYFTDINSLFTERIELTPLGKQGFWKVLGDNFLKFLQIVKPQWFCFEFPQTMKKDSFFWLRDEEFARQTLAGLHPCYLQSITEWPLVSKLDPNVYGLPESAITTEMIEREIKGFMTVEEAIKEKKLFILDYHDLFLPFVSQVRQLKNTTLYGSRTVFFLTPDGTLRPLAIELTRPPLDGKLQWKQVYTPSWDATGVWLWTIAKAHVLAHDSGYHQLVSHWLRTHCCTEPYIIAANRQLSAMHPIYRLMHPHFRYTMEINALARKRLINAEGLIESTFSPGKYSILLSSVVYDKQWQFDHQALPKDLINRGMAVADSSAPHGLKLNIEDYPYANDGLVLWDIIKEWVGDYVNYYYPEPSLVSSDKELQAWWYEVRNVGHGDKKDEPWWPELITPQNLIETITTIIWTASGHHAAVNFGQYTYGGYFPNRPTIARKNMPTEDPSDAEWKSFTDKPEERLLQTFPSKVQATKVMAVLNVLSTHSGDEEYIGEQKEQAWLEDPFVKGAFEKFNGKLKELEGILDERNANTKLKNRNGAGVVPYELLKPFWIDRENEKKEKKGVPNSISI